MTTQKINNSNPYDNGSAVLQPARVFSGNLKSLSSQFPENVRPANQYEFANTNVKFATVSVTSGAPTVVAAIAGKKIRVLSYVVISDAAQTATWQSASNNISGAMSLDANGGASAQHENGMFETNAGEALRLLPSASGTISGHITYLVY